MKKTHKLMILPALILAGAATLVACGGGSQAVTYVGGASSDLDSDYYNEEYASNISSHLYAGMLLGTQSPITEVSLTLDNGNYTFVKEAYQAGAKDTGFDLKITFKGTYTSTEEGVYTLAVPTDGSRLWFISDMYVSYLDSFGLIYPGEETAAAGVTSKVVYSETEQEIDPDGYPIWSDADGVTYMEKEQDGATVYVSMVDNTVVLDSNEGLTKVMAIDHVDMAETTFAEDSSINYWFNSMFVVASQDAEGNPAPVAQKVTVDEETLKIISIENA